MHIPVHTHACWHMCVCWGVHICGHVRVCAGVCWHVHGCVRACAHACAGVCLHRPPVFTLFPSAVPEDADPCPAWAPRRASSRRRHGRPWAARLGQCLSRSVTRTPRAWPRWRSRHSLRTRGPRLDGRRLCRSGRADPSVWSAEAAPRGQGYEAESRSRPSRRWFWPALAWSADRSRDVWPRCFGDSERQRHRLPKGFLGLAEGPTLPGPAGAPCSVPRPPTPATQAQLTSSGESACGKRGGGWGALSRGSAVSR